MIEPRNILRNISRAPTNTEGRIGRVMRLDHNERTTSLPQAVLDAVWKTISPEEVVAYPALEGLYHKLARSLGVSREELLLTYGSDTAIRMVFDTYVNPGEEVVFLNPSYGMFAVYCDMFGAKKRMVAYDLDFNLPVTRVIDAISSQTKLVIIADPNHTGTAMAQADLSCVIEAATKANALVIIDEAYHYFYPQTILGQIKHFDNLIVIRSLSKAFGIAPLRVGYIISHPANIANLYKVKLTHDITSVSAKFAEYFIDHPEIVCAHVKDVDEGKAYLTKSFAQIGGYVFPSVTNFVFVRLPQDVGAKQLVKALEEQGVWIKGPFQGPPVDGLIRITVGPEFQMREFMDYYAKTIEMLKGKALC